MVFVNDKMKKPYKINLNKTNKSIILTGVTIGLFFIGFVMGCMFTHYNYFKLVDSIDIMNLEIDLNETQIVNTIFERKYGTSNLEFNVKGELIE